jgi:tyrosyl-tRNA synthetase
MAKTSTDQKKIDWLLNHAVENVYPNKDAVRERLMKGEVLTVYYGIDPTGPTLHLGHLITMRKLSELQELGHKVILLIGDFTAMIGDPTDKTATRKQF